LKNRGQFMTFESRTYDKKLKCVFSGYHVDLELFNWNSHAWIMSPWIWRSQIGNFNWESQDYLPFWCNTHDWSQYTIGMEVVAFLQVWAMVCFMSLVHSLFIHVPFWVELALTTFLLSLSKLISPWTFTCEFVLVPF
jgi:hypothetical protein